MTDNQIARITAAKTNMSYMDSYHTIWGSNTKISAAVAVEKGTITDIDAAAEIQAMVLKGYTKTEHTARATAMDLTMHAVSGLKSYYEDINDESHYGDVNHPISYYKLCSKEECVVRMTKIFDMASAITPALLVPFEVTATDLTNLQNAISDYAIALPGKEATQADVKTATKNIKTLLTLLSKNQKKLSNLVDTLKPTQPDFVKGYYNSKKVINLGKTMQAVEQILKPLQYVFKFGMKFTIGDTLTVRNPNDFDIMVAIVDDKSGLPPASKFRTVKAKVDVSLAVPDDFGGVLGHYLLIYNPNTMDTVKVTVILAKGKSASKAGQPELTGTPKPI